MTRAKIKYDKGRYGGYVVKVGNRIVARHVGLQRAQEIQTAENDRLGIGYNVRTDKYETR
jgi:hypothetical protein